MQRLAESVLQYEDLLTTVSDICGELDRYADGPTMVDSSTLILHSLLALAQGAKMYNLTRPRVVEDNIIQIKGGR